jgi:amidophosphoribosyltransferase
MDGRRCQRYVRAVSVIDDDHFHDQCGVFGVFGAEEASNLAYLGLHSLQHRGQEAAGIVSSNGEQLFVHRGMGLVQDVFTADLIEKLPGSSATHNGNLTNGLALRHQLERDGSIFASDSDTEVFVHLIARSKSETMVDRVADALHQVEGAYSLVFLSPDELVAVRDPYGFRPLCLGKLDDAYVIASEPPAFQLIGAEFIRDIKPGEMVVINDSGLQSLRPFRTDAERRYMCIFEYVYFARPDASFDGISVYDARKRMGHALAEDQPVEADIVVPVPDSGVAAALGYAEAAGLPFELGLIRSHYVGRTFIEPAQSIRHFGVRLKLHPVQSLLEGKRIVVIDDSIVRGTTSRKIVKMIRDAGAKEVHLRISSPPTSWPCFYGIDTPTREELIAAHNSVDEVNDYVTADSLGYLSLDGLKRAVGGEGFCSACFSGRYPIPVTDDVGLRRQLPLVGV